MIFIKDKKLFYINLINYLYKLSRNENFNNRQINIILDFMNQSLKINKTLSYYIYEKFNNFQKIQILNKKWPFILKEIYKYYKLNNINEEQLKLCKEVVNKLKYKMNIFNEDIDE